MFVAVPAVAAGAAAVAYLRKPKGDAAEADKADGDKADGVESDAEVVESASTAAEQEKVEAKTWRETAGRESGPEGYVFGDLTRGVVVRLRGGPKTKEEQDVEAAGDEQYTHVQALVRDAIAIFRARGYTGTINMTQTVGHFSESTSVRVDPPKDGKAPWEDVASDAKAVAMGEHGRAGKVFTTLLTRLERRAASWDDFAGCEGLDPSLTSSAHIGFALPVIKIGWGVSVSLTVSTSSLLRYAKFVAGEDVSAEPKQLQQNTGDNHSMEQNELIADSVADTMG